MEEIEDQYFITIVLDNVPLGKAIEYVCAAAGLKFNVGNYAVEISSSDILSKLETVVFPIEIEQYIQEQTQSDGSTTQTVQLKNFFTERGIKFQEEVLAIPESGIKFQEGASAIYDAKISRLIIRNNSTEIAKISKLLTRLNTNAPQVSISAKFVEIQQKDFEELGFEWRTSMPTSGKATSWENNDPINRFALVDNIAEKNATKDRVFGVNYAGPQGLTFDAVIHALDQNEKINLLSAPKVTTLSGQQAEIRMTTETYFPTQWQAPKLVSSTDSTSSSYYIPPSPVFKNPTQVGIIFFVQPFVESDRYTIDLELEPQIQKFIGWSDYSYNISISGSTDSLDAILKMPKFEVQSVQTHLKVYDGETVVLGGVLKDDTKTTDDRIPMLGDMPLLGRFFRSEIEDADKTNLLIFTKVLLVKPDGSPLRPKMGNGLPDFRYK